MKIKTLEYFVVLAESQSINEAAKKLYIAQPSLTKALHNMEEELGFQLFLRSKAGVNLTEEGKQILPEAKQMLSYYNNWLNLSQQHSLRKINLYIHTSFSDLLFPPIVVQFRERYPDLTINVVTDFHPHLRISNDIDCPALALFLCDEGETYQRFCRLQGNQPLVLFRGKYECLVSPDSPVAQQEFVTLEDLRNLYLILPRFENLPDTNPPFSQSYNLIHNSPKQRVIDVESLSNVISLVRDRPETFAISYYPALERYRDVQEKRLIHIPIHDGAAPGPLCLFYSKQAYRQHPEVRDLIQTVSKSIQQFPMLTNTYGEPSAGGTGSEGGTP